MSRYTYDVFLSFRGEDTRYGFTGNLYSALSRRGIFTFFDDDALRKGEEINPSLRKAIQESRISIIVFSKNYASSTFCLDELVHILECYTKQNMWVLPVFYDVDPSHVRHQKGSFGEAFAQHERGRFKDDIQQLQKWRMALHQAADLSGSHFKIGGEYEFEIIKKITEEISNKLNRHLLHIACYPVGLQVRVQRIQELMNAQFDNKVIMLGIHGMGGIGKSTLARAIYNLRANQFESSCFLANVREKSIKHGLVHIQETILSELVEERDIKLGDVHRGIPTLQKRLCRKKVFLVLDDIDKKEQLQATAGGLNWFGPGSIIIITTRDKRLLDTHEIKNLYEVGKLNFIQSLELFRWNAFKNKKDDPNKMELIKRALYCAGGLPLALEIIGSNFVDKTLDEEWDSVLKTYERFPNRDIQEILRVSYDSLDTNEREIFLDIACFFSGYTLRYVTNMLEARGFQPKFGIRVLQEKSLINIDSFSGSCDDQIVIMHDLVRSMGKEMVREQSNLPEKRNRLWFCEDIVRALDKNTEYEIEVMMLDMPKDLKVQWNQTVYRKMKNLQMMLVKSSVASLRMPKDLPNSLRVLEWWGYPGASLPSNFHLKNLVILNLLIILQNSKMLRQLVLKGCKNIRRIPDMSGLPNLTELCLAECTNLIKIHDSVGFLHNLQWFCAEGCTKLGIFPRCIKLTSLEHLCIKDCSSLVMLPEILAPMQKLKYVDLDGTSIKHLPRSMQNLKGLQFLSMNRCKMLEINGRSNVVQMLPKLFPYLKELLLDESSLTIIPACIEECHYLYHLSLYNCKKLREIRGLPPNMTRLTAENSLVEVDSSTLNMLVRRVSLSSIIVSTITCLKNANNVSQTNTLSCW
uniref:TMV resistance protein N n=1 Tax=Cajanus cajan TaxID=3821 RepID=A0A151QP77_CAJCA|nr:TMV resistance protein N [Cajanus cajan]